MVAADLADFIQDATLRLLGALVVAFIDGIHVGFSALELHVLTSSLEKIRLPESSLFSCQLR